MRVVRIREKSPLNPRQRLLSEISVIDTINKTKVMAIDALDELELE